ncbi:MAG: methylmalonic aciduria and homocystinuria type D protein [Kovacikia sp.]
MTHWGRFRINTKEGGDRSKFDMQYSVHAPSQFICTHLDRLLPDWSSPVLSVLVVLQPCSCDLVKKTSIAEAQKQRLRQNFLQFGYRVASQLQQKGHLAEVFDPRTGLPLLSQAGQLRLDDVAIVRSCLGYQTMDSAGCLVILHPLWGSSVYPSTLLSAAAPEVVALVSATVGREMQNLFQSEVQGVASDDRNATNPLRAVAS